MIKSCFHIVGRRTFLHTDILLTHLLSDRILHFYNTHQNTMDSYSSFLQIQVHISMCSCLTGLEYTYLRLNKAEFLCSNSNLCHTNVRPNRLHKYIGMVGDRTLGDIRYAVCILHSSFLANPVYICTEKVDHIVPHF